MNCFLSCTNPLHHWYCLPATCQGRVAPLAAKFLIQTAKAGQAAALNAHYGGALRAASVLAGVDGFDRAATA
jgi:hypothetical protein